VTVLNHLHAVKSKPAGAMWLGQHKHNFASPTVKHKFNKGNLKQCCHQKSVSAD